MKPSGRVWLACLGAAALSTALVSVPSAPALAADNGSIGGSAADITVGIAPSPGKNLLLQVDGSNAIAAKVTIDYARLAGIAKVDAPQGCTESGTTITCELSSVPAMVPLRVHATSAKPGDTGTVSFTMSAANASTSSASATVTFGDGIDLVIDSANSTLELTGKPGDHLMPTIAFGNAGSKAAVGARLTLVFDHGLLPDAYDNCAYGTEGHSHVAVCEIPDTLEPKASIALQTRDASGNATPGFGVTVAADSSGSAYAGYLVQGLAEAAPKAAATMSKRQASGHTLTAVAGRSARAATALPSDIDQGDNYGGFAVTVKGTHQDLAMLGANTTGKVGDVVKVSVGVKNNGPAVYDNTRMGGGGGVVFIVIPPVNTEVVAAPENCAPVTEDNGTAKQGTWGAAGGTYYHCVSPDFLAVNESSKVEFSLKVTKVVPDDRGTVTLHDKYVAQENTYKDDNPTNDSADILINSTGTGGAGGGLPVTGVRIGLIVVIGLIALLAGTVLMVLTRRRRDPAAEQTNEKTE